MQIELNDEMVSKLVASELQDYKETLQKDYVKVLRTKKGFVYDFDWRIDVQEIERRIDAIELILKDYT